MNYGPQMNVNNFFAKHGAVGKEILEAYDDADPLRCCLIPDEYLSYAERCIEVLAREVSMGNLKHLSDVLLVEEAVRRSFYVSQIASGQVTPEKIAEIAKAISLGLLRELSDKLN